MWSSLCCCCGHASRKLGGLDRNVTLLLIGLDNAGKTCTARSIIGDPPVTAKKQTQVVPTVGFSKVETKYRGFHVTLFDLGGSRAFRGVWSKYYHEIHGYIFVVDSSDAKRMDECRETLREVLRHPQVRGKPLLVLCNKSDADESKDETHCVEELHLEGMVNEAKCPTRVEQSVAHKGLGLRVGFKWLVKSVIANWADLGPRVEADVKLEKQLEAKRREETRRRIEERRRQREKDESESSESSSPATQAVVHDPGFVPLSELQKSWQRNEVEARIEKVKQSSTSEPIHEESEPEPELEEPLPRPPRDVASEAKPFEDTSFSERKASQGSVPGVASASAELGVGMAPGQVNIEREGEEDEVPEVKPKRIRENNFTLSTPSPVKGSKKSMSSSSPTKPTSSALGNLPPLPAMTKVEKLDLEPITQPGRKKKNFMKKLNNRTAPLRSGSMDSRVGSSSVGSSAESLRDSQVIRAYS